MIREGWKHSDITWGKTIVKVLVSPVRVKVRTDSE